MLSVTQSHFPIGFDFKDMFLSPFQVYKTQLERVSDGWHIKMSSFERLNSSLRSSLSELQAENNELKTMVCIQNSKQLLIYLLFT